MTSGGTSGGQARTRLARRAVVAAARDLFLDRGYQATTIDAISDRADVPAATVYRLFSSKHGILKGLLDVSIAGDDRALSLPSASDPAAAALFADYQRARAEGQGRFARSLARAGALAPGLRERDAADLVHALLSPELYRLLVADRGWAPARYERWLTELVAGQLTGPDA